MHRLNVIPSLLSDLTSDANCESSAGLVFGRVLGCLGTDAKPGRFHLSQRSGPHGPELERDDPEPVQCEFDQLRQTIRRSSQWTSLCPAALLSECGDSGTGKP